MKNRLLLLFLICVFSFLVYFLYRSYGFIFFVKDHQIIKLVLKENFFAKEQRELSVEVVNTQNSVTQGLSMRKDLESRSGQKIDGLLFVFPKKEIRQFWMKDMLFNIDICWLDNLTIFSCEREIPASFSNQNLKIHQSPLVTNLVLETKPNKLSNDEIKLKLFFKW